MELYKKKDQKKLKKEIETDLNLGGKLRENTKYAEDDGDEYEL